ncbi:MAG: hypothetical protein ABMA15_06070, partial [Vicinamibacterales bacterium]
ALDHFREALRLDPTYGEAHYNMGSLSRSGGRLSEAVDHLRQAVRFKPDLAPAVASLAWLLATSADRAILNPTEALALAERAVTLTGRGDAGMLDILAAAYASASQFERAIAISEAALTLKPDAGLAAAIRERAEQYRQRRPYRSPSESSRTMRP